MKSCQEPSYGLNEESRTDIFLEWKNGTEKEAMKKIKVETGFKGGF